MLNKLLRAAYKTPKTPVISTEVLHSNTERRNPAEHGIDYICGISRLRCAALEMTGGIYYFVGQFFGNE